MAEHTSKIHPLAVIEPGAKIADDVEIGPWTYVGADVEIGEGTVVASHVVIKGPSVIGKHNKIYQFATVGDDTPDLKYKGEPTRLVMGDHNTVREGVTIHRGTVQDRSETTIGNHNLFMAYVHIGHDCVVGNHCVFVNNASVAGHVYVGDYAILSGYTLVHQFCHVGAHSFLGMACGVKKDIPPYMMVYDHPARVRSINVEGLKRRGFSAEAITGLRRAYKILYRQGNTVDQAVNLLEEMQDETPEVKPLIDAIKSSTRGIQR